MLHELSSTVPTETNGLGGQCNAMYLVGMKFRQGGPSFCFVQVNLIFLHLGTVPHKTNWIFDLSLTVSLKYLRF